MLVEKQHKGLGW